MTNSKYFININGSDIIIQKINIIEHNYNASPLADIIGINYVTGSVDILEKIFVPDFSKTLDTVDKLLITLEQLSSNLNTTISNLKRDIRV